MKSNAQPPLYFSMYPLNARKTEASAAKARQISPYLKAILSGKGGAPPRGFVVRMMNSDRMAAIRYIKESQRRGQP